MKLKKSTFALFKATLTMMKNSNVYVAMNAHKNVQTIFNINLNLRAKRMHTMIDYSHKQPRDFRFTYGTKDAEYFHTGYVRARSSLEAGLEIEQQNLVSGEYELKQIFDPAEESGPRDLTRRPPRRRRRG